MSGRGDRGHHGGHVPNTGGAPPVVPVYREGMPELMLPRLIESAATAIDGSLSESCAR